MQNKRVGGFTLTETMFVVAIIGIGFAIGVPSFSGLAKRSRITASVNDLITGFQLARSEAAKRGVAVTICPTDATVSDDDDSVNCDRGGTWSDGVIVFADENASGSRDDGDELIHFISPLRQDVFVNVSDDLATGLTYGGDGFPDAQLNASQLVFCDEPDDQTRRAVISMSTTGRPATARSMTVPGDLEC